jgi:hypothetical protein
MKRINGYRKLISVTWNQGGKNLSILTVIYRLVKWMIKRDGMFTDFFMLGMHKAETDPAEIIREPEFEKLQKKLSPIYYRCLLEDKYVFDRFLKGFDFPVAEMIGTIENERIRWLDQNLRPLDGLAERKPGMF